MTAARALAPVPSPRVILGVDHGTQRAGVAIISAPSGTRLHSAQITLRGTTPQARLAFLYNALGGICRRYHPEVLAIERPIPRQAARSGTGEIQAEGNSPWIGAGFAICALTAAHEAIALRLIAPSTAKVALSGDGRADKDGMVRCARMRFALELCGKDEADALGIALAALSPETERKRRA